MATPSSSATSPSPGLSFTLPASASENSTDEHNDAEQAEREERRKKLLARTEFAKITRALRSTLALASFKTQHNVANVPLQNLEAQIAKRSHYPNHQPAGQTSLSLFPATFGNEKKRKAGSAANNAVFYNSPLSQGGSNYGMSGMGLSGNASSSSMSMPSQHPSYTFPPPSPSMASAPANPSKSLFASIISLPPAKRARTIHNPEAPPVPPPPPPPQAHTKKTPKKSTKKGKEAAGTSKGKAADKKGKGKEKEKKSTLGRARANSIDSVRTRSSFNGETDNVNDTDMKAAETLTDLLFSRSGATGSPHSSFSAATSASRMAPAGPTVSALPLSQTSSGSSIAPSAAQQHRAHVRTASNASTASVNTSILERDPLAPHTDAKSDGRRSATPTMNTRSGTRSAGAPAGQSLGAQASHVFGAPAPPKQHAVDSEAADLMLLLANSPSPARPTVPRDQDITRNAYAAGRVLFPSGPSGSQSSDAGSGGGGGGVLKRVASFSSIDGGEVAKKGSNSIRAGSESEAATSPPLSQAELSPALEPQRASPSGSTALRPVPTLNIGQLLPSPSLAQAGPLTPSGFHLTDYINVSPSPAAPSAPSQSSSTSQHAQQSTSSHSSQQLSSTMGSNSTGRFNSAVSVSSPLRKSFDRDGVGLGVNARKLFETEPSAGGGAGSVGVSGGGTGRKMLFGEGVEGAGSLGSGIDLVQT